MRIVCLLGSRILAIVGPEGITSRLDMVLCSQSRAHGHLIMTLHLELHTLIPSLIIRASVKI